MLLLLIIPYQIPCHLQIGDSKAKICATFKECVIRKPDGNFGFFEWKHLVCSFVTFLKNHLLTFKLGECEVLKYSNLHNDICLQ